MNEMSNHIKLEFHHKHLISLAWFKILDVCQYQYTGVSSRRDTPKTSIMIMIISEFVTQCGFCRNMQTLHKMQQQYWAWSMATCRLMLPQTRPTSRVSTVLALQTGEKPSENQSASIFYYYFFMIVGWGLFSHEWIAWVKLKGVQSA